MYEQNPAIQNILSRRSIRRYDADKEVPQEMRRILVECACAAPSAHNFKPWHFILIDEREKLNAIADAHPYGKMLKTATLAIAVCGEAKDEDRDLSYWEEDCAAAMQNILLAANALSLGSVWLGVRHAPNALEDRIKALCDIPEDIALMGIAAIGFPMETKDPHKGIDPASIHLNKW
ncbi:nitroreductase family protein [Synergistaceae bacterium OttesenSCG-928-D05]|nr:nitroreductase family protein [Synergistaceae bacterium OttesenSCG-928-D05]